MQTTSSELVVNDAAASGAGVAANRVVEVVIEEADGRITMSNAHWTLSVGILGVLDPSLLIDRSRDVPVADEHYAYELVLGAQGSDGFAGGDGAEVTSRRVRFESWEQSDLTDGGKEVRFRGRFDFGLLGPTDIVIEHTFRLPTTAPWVEEQIRLIHHFGRDTHAVKRMRLGFRKMLFDRDTQTWLHGADRKSLIPVPHRRRWGQSVDHLTGAYSANDLVPTNWSGQQQPGRGAEAWLWIDDDAGYLIAKYNREQIEYALADGEFILAPSKRSSDYYHTFDPRVAGGASLCLRFGGFGQYNRSPEAMESIGPGMDLTLGVTRIYPVTGDWQIGYGVYKTFLLEQGHGCPPDFDPPLHWNELYNLGWRGGDNAPLQELPELYDEAERAQDIGAEAFYFDPVWDIVEGSTVWDEERLGPLADFVGTMRDQYGLKTSLHLMMHTKTIAEDEQIYRRTADGAIDVWGGLYRGGYINGASPAWQHLKTERLLRLAEAGVTFFMFDFLDYPRDGTDSVKGRHHPTRTAYYRDEHGQLVPITMQAHAEGILKVIQAVKQRYPHVLIEAHDRVNGGLQDFHPLYFQHGLPNSFDENWGFEYMWDPFMDLLSGKALSLYEYNLAYDIPLYLHIHCGQDNEQMLAFWWYASTCRHLGIGGVKTPTEPLYQSLKAAVTAYRRLKPFFSRGRFIGAETFVHGHVLPERGAVVFTLFNLGSAPVHRSVSLSAADLGISSISSCTGAEVRLADGYLVFEVDVPPLSPLLVEVNT